MDTLQPLFQCSICFGKLNRPKALSCLHSFCSACLQKYVTSSGFVASVPCPTCRQLTEIPPPGGAAGAEKLLVNSYLISLMDAAESISRSPPDDEAAFLAGVGCRMPNGGNPPESEGIACGRHGTQPTQLFCVTCSCMICIDCVLTVCKQHEHETIAGAASKGRCSLVAMAARADGLASDLSRLDRDINEHSSRLTVQAELYHRLLKNEKSQLQEALNAAYDRAVQTVQQAVTLWGVRAETYLGKVNLARAEALDISGDLKELISHHSDCDVLAKLSDIRQRLDVLQAPKLLENPIPRINMALYQTSALAALKNCFRVVTRDESVTTRSKIKSRVKQPRFHDNTTSCAQSSGCAKTDGSEASGTDPPSCKEDCSPGIPDIHAAEGVNVGSAAVVPISKTSSFKEQLITCLGQMTTDENVNLQYVCEDILALMDRTTCNSSIMHSMVSAMFGLATTNPDVIMKLSFVCKRISEQRKVKRKKCPPFQAILNLRVLSDFMPMSLELRGKSQKSKHRLRSAEAMLNQLRFVVALSDAGCLYPVRKPVLHYEEEGAPSGRPRSILHECITLCLTSRSHRMFLEYGCALLLQYGHQLFTAPEKGPSKKCGGRAYLDLHISRILLLQASPDTPLDLAAILQAVLNLAANNWGA